MTTRKRAENPQKRTGDYHHGDLKRALLDAALSLVEEEGVASLTLREVARRAGVSNAAPYRHFADRATLVAAVADEGFQAMVASMRRARARGSDPVTRFRALGIAYVTFALAHPSRFRVMFSAEAALKAHEEPLKASADASFGLLIEAIAECQEIGVVRAGERKILAGLVWSTAHGLSTLLLEEQLQARGVAARDAPEDVIDALFLGLAAR